MKLIKNSELSARQKAVFDAITKEFLTVNQLAKKLDISIQAVYKLIRKIRKKGYMMDTVLPTSRKEKTGGLKSDARSPPSPQIRIHGQQFKISIIKIIKKVQFQKLIGKKFNIQGNLIKIWHNCIEVYSNKDHIGFLGATETEAEIKSFNYWLDLFYKLEAGLGVILTQDSLDNIEMNKCHYAHIHDGISFHYATRKETLKVFGRDGKMWLDIDNSKQLYELEMKHPGRAASDSRIMGKYLNDIRDNKPALLSELSKGFIKHLEQEHGMVLRNQKVGKQEILTNPEYIG